MPKALVSAFASAFTRAVNHESRENVSNTPDFIIGAYLDEALNAAEKLIAARDKWYGIEPAPGKAKPALNDVRVAVARGWCADKNGEEMDGGIAEAISLEIAKLFGVPTT